MLLRCAKTGSDGNAFAIETDNQILLLEAGVPIPDIKKMINYRIDKVVGSLISHQHT